MVNIKNETSKILQSLLTESQTLTKPWRKTDTYLKLKLKYCVIIGKFVGDSQCEKLPVEICGKGCVYEEGEEECHNKVS